MIEERDTETKTRRLALGGSWRCAVSGVWWWVAEPQPQPQPQPQPRLTVELLRQSIDFELGLVYSRNGATRGNPASAGTLVLTQVSTHENVCKLLVHTKKIGCFLGASGLPPTCGL